MEPEQLNAEHVGTGNDVTGKQRSMILGFKEEGDCVLYNHWLERIVAFTYYSSAAYKGRS